MRLAPGSAREIPRCGRPGPRRSWATLLAIAILAGSLCPSGATGLSASGDLLARESTVTPWVTRLQLNERDIVDQVVICFDEGAFLAEIGRWDKDKYWPVLLWDSVLVPGFIRAFGPARVLLARFSDSPDPTADEGLRVVARAWGATAPAGLLTLRERRELVLDLGRDPLGAVLLARRSPEWLGGLAEAAARFALPVILEAPERQTVRVSEERVAQIERELTARLDRLEIEYRGKFDDLDLLTVANDMPFGYTREAAEAHPGAYTVDDALGRNDDLTRWAWTGRLLGGAARSVYMVMGAVFLQPDQGLFWSRYDPNNRAFGSHDPGPALESFERLFPTRVVRHPEATLAGWRDLQWPGGNRFGFLYVNSSGGASNWSVSGGQASHIDVPATVPCIVHYTHSGSAARPFLTDSIAGRWLTAGAYVYSGSYAEPYLQAFVTPETLAARVTLGVPLGAALRQVYDPDAVGARKMNVSGSERVVRFNMTGPWKLAYLGDPACRLRRDRPARLDPDEAPPGRRPTSLTAFLREHPRGPEQARMHRRASVSVALLASSLGRGRMRLVDERRWSAILKRASDQERPELLGEMVRVWVVSLQRREIGAEGRDRRRNVPLDPPGPIRELLAGGVHSPAASRAIEEYAKGALARATSDDVSVDDRGRTGERRVKALRALELVCCFLHGAGSRKPLFAWVKSACEPLGISVSDLRTRVLQHTWVTGETRDIVSRMLPAEDTDPGKTDPDAEGILP